MDHVAILKPSLKLLDKILSGEKTIESRWYMNRIDPIDKIKAGDVIYFKNAGKPVTAMAEVSDIQQYCSFNNEFVRGLIKEYGNRIGLNGRKKEFFEQVKNKKYCMLAFLENVRTIEPFNINKKGYGVSCAWICVDNVDKIKK